MGFHFELLIFFGLIFAEVAVVVGVVYMVVRFVTHMVRREWDRTEMPR